jgi:hypothetical protein
MNTIKVNVGIGRPSLGHPITGQAVSDHAGYVGFQAWRARPTTEAKSALSGLVMADAPVTKPLLVSASERCP